MFVATPCRIQRVRAVAHGCNSEIIFQFSRANARPTRNRITWIGFATLRSGYASPKGCDYCRKAKFSNANAGAASYGRRSIETRHCTRSGRNRDRVRPSNFRLPPSEPYNLAAMDARRLFRSKHLRLALALVYATLLVWLVPRTPTAAPLVMIALGVPLILRLVPRNCSPATGCTACVRRGLCGRRKKHGTGRTSLRAWPWSLSASSGWLYLPRDSDSHT
jgi:hypothetical protein